MTQERQSGLEENDLNLLRRIDALKNKIFQNDGVLNLQIFKEYESDIQLVSEILFCSKEPSYKEIGENLFESSKSAPETIKDFEDFISNTHTSVSVFKTNLLKLIDESMGTDIDFSQELPLEGANHKSVDQGILRSFQALNKLTDCIIKADDCLMEALQDRNKEEELKGRLIANFDNITYVETLFCDSQKEFSSHDIVNINSIAENFDNVGRKITDLSADHTVKSFFDHDASRICTNLHFLLGGDATELQDQFFGKESGILKQKLIVAKYGFLFLLSRDLLNADLPERHIPSLKTLIQDFSTFTNSNEKTYPFRHHHTDGKISFLSSDTLNPQEFPDIKIPLSMGRMIINAIENTSIHGQANQCILSAKMSEDGNFCILEILDDGNGLDIKTIKTRAIAQKIVTEEGVHNMTEAEICNLVLEPHFSGDGKGTGKGLMKSKEYELSIDNQGLVNKEKMNHDNHRQGTRLTVRIPLNKSQEVITAVSTKTAAITKA